MTRFNARQRKYDPVIRVVANRAGGSAYDLELKEKFATLLLSSFLSDGAYRSGANTLVELTELLKDIVEGSRDDSGELFALRAAIFARRELGMRSVSHVIAAELGWLVKRSWSRQMFREIAVRPDDITETLAYYMGKYGKPIPNAMKRGFADALSGYSEYQLGKYGSKGKAVSLVDAVNLCHPKSTPALSALVNGTLPPPETWEVLLTEAGQRGRTEREKEILKQAAWVRLITEGKIGYFALLRNLRNIIRDAPECIDRVCEILVDEERVRASRLLPFRFLVARRSLQPPLGFNGYQPALPGSGKVMSAVEQAMEISLANVPVLPGKTAVLVDISGSMSSKQSNSGDVRIVDIAALFGASLAMRNDADVIVFNDAAKYVYTREPIGLFAYVNGIASMMGGGTDFNVPFEIMDKKYDRIVILSDMQGWIRTTGQVSFDKYKKRHSARPVVYSWDLAGYGTAQFLPDNVITLAGMSEKIFDFIRYSERGAGSLVDFISNYTPNVRRGAVEQDGRDE